MHVHHYLFKHKFAKIVHFRTLPGHFLNFKDFPMMFLGVGDAAVNKVNEVRTLTKYILEKYITNWQ